MFSWRSRSLTGGRRRVNESLSAPVTPAALFFPAGPGKSQEVLRRKIENGVREFWYFIRSEVKKLSSLNAADLQRHTDMLLKDLGHHQRSAMTGGHAGMGAIILRLLTGHIHGSIKTKAQKCSGH